MNDNIITFSLRNWITVFLMWLAMWAILSLGVKFLRGNKGSGETDDAAQGNSFAGAGVQ
jgi:hypothetical protein